MRNVVCGTGELGREAGGIHKVSQPQNVDCPTNHGQIEAPKTTWQDTARRKAG